MFVPELLIAGRGAKWVEPGGRCRYPPPMPRTAIRLRRALPCAVALGVAVLPSIGCKRSQLARSAYQAPVDDDATSGGDGAAGGAGTDEGNGANPGAAQRPPGAAPRYDFSPETTHFCGLVSCDHKQMVQVERVMEDARITRDAQVDATEAQARLAEAFRGASLRADDVQRYFDAVGDGDDRVRQQAQVLSSLHELLDPPQRRAVATAIDARGPGYVLGLRRGGRRGAGATGTTGKVGKAGARGGRGGAGTGPGGGGRPSLAERQKRRVGGICDHLECTDAQRRKLLSEARKIERDDLDADIASMHLKLAVVMRKDDAPPEAVARQMTALREKQRQRERVISELVASIHAVLTPEQRGVVAEDIADQGPGVALGFRGGARDRGEGAGEDGEPSSPTGGRGGGDRDLDDVSAGDP